MVHNHNAPVLNNGETKEANRYISTQEAHISTLWSYRRERKRRKLVYKASQPFQGEIFHQNTINAKSMLLTYAKSSTSTMEKKARTKWEKTYTDPNRNYKLQTSNKVDLQIIKDAIPKRPRTTSSVSGL